MSKSSKCDPWRPGKHKVNTKNLRFIISSLMVFVPVLWYFQAWLMIFECWRLTIQRFHSHTFYVTLCLHKQLRAVRRDHNENCGRFGRMGISWPFSFGAVQLFISLSCQQHKWEFVYLLFSQSMNKSSIKLIKYKENAIHSGSKTGVFFIMQSIYFYS